jgi:signal transduction histidine kinase
MNKLSILLLPAFVFLINTFSFANLDSLKSEFYAQNGGEKKLELAYEIAKRTIFSKPDTATKYLLIALKDSVQFRNSVQLAKCLNAYGIYHFNISQLDSTLYYCGRALDIFLRNADTSASVLARKNISLANRNMGKYDVALNDFFKILEYFKKTGDTANTASMLNDIGNTFAYLKDYDKTIAYQHEALALLREVPNDRLAGNVLNSIGVAFSNLGLKDSARIYYEKSLVFKERSGDIYSITITRNNLCTLIDYKKEPEKCEQCLIDLLADQRQVNNSKDLALTFLNLARQYTYYRDCHKALSTLDSCGVYLRQSGDIFLKQHYYELFALALSRCGTFEQAYLYQDSLLALNDSVFAIQKQEEFMDLDAKYQNQKKIEDIRLLEIENANTRLKIKNQQWQILALILFLSVLTGGSIFFFVYTKQRQKRQRELALIKMREAERVRIARDMHDEIGSGLTRISMMSEQLKLNDNASEDLAEGMVSKIIKQSRLLSGNLKEIIWAIDPGNDKLSELLFYFRDYIYDFSTHTNIEFEIDFPDDAPDFEVASQVRRNLFLALKEILNNLSKYAQAKNVAVKFELKKQEGFLTITDDGVGFDPEKVKKGIGLDSIKARVEKLDGIFEINSKPDDGTQITLSHLKLITTKV